MKDSVKLGAAVIVGAGLIAWLKKKAAGIKGIGELSPYSVTVMVLIPKSGIVTKHDEKLLSQFGFAKLGKAVLVRWCRNQESAYSLADEIIESDEIRHKLDKSYTCYEITDKQFSMIDNRGEWTKDAILDVVTTRQNERRWTVYNGKPY